MTLSTLLFVGQPTKNLHGTYTHDMVRNGGTVYTGATLKLDSLLLALASTSTSTRLVLVLV